MKTTTVLGQDDAHEQEKDNKRADRSEKDEGQVEHRSSPSRGDPRWDRLGHEPHSQAEQRLPRRGPEHDRRDDLIKHHKNEEKGDRTTGVEDEPRLALTERVAAEEPLVDLDHDEHDDPAERDRVDHPGAHAPTETSRALRAPQVSKGRSRRRILPRWLPSQLRDGSSRWRRVRVRPR